MVSIDALVRA